MNFLKVSEGQYRIGSSQYSIDNCVLRWRSNLINPNYKEEIFRSWIEKEFPQHRVNVKAFEMAETPVTHKDILKFLETGISVPESVHLNSTPDQPVWGVSVQWADQFAAWLSGRDESYRYRLPTETEWEVAARGPDALEYPFGEEFDPTACNTLEAKIGTTSSVYRFSHRPAPFGHLDMAGNVEEWVSSKYYTYPGGRLVEDDLYERLGLNYHPLRGGNFLCGGDLARGARRHGPFPSPLFRFTGFRLVREAI